ncbi:Ankyrin repeat domain-containing protein 50 [Phytophthora cinnamomi]|uniref:Ankyrin repeat domain-containing protein 50 n=1 Tax=Phytophthora cinnamomi TaxID=4785 RepID=UPI00355AB877|nr:Ankyrin repeat domain-containing protein 50 [Phytophthora cinnamomi]
MSRSCSLSIWPRRRHARLAARTTDRSASNALDRRDQPNYSSSVADTQQAWLTAADAGDLPALHVCAWRSHRELAVFLLARGADVAPLDEAGMTALQTELLRLHIEKMRDVPLLRSRCIDACSPVAIAAFKRNLAPDRSTYDEIETRAFDLLLAHDVDVNNRSKEIRRWSRPSSSD